MSLLFGSGWQSILDPFTQVKELIPNFKKYSITGKSAEFIPLLK